MHLIRAALAAILAVIAVPALAQGMERVPDRPAGEGDGPYASLLIKGATMIDGSGAPPEGPVDEVTGSQGLPGRHQQESNDARQSGRCLQALGASVEGRVEGPNEVRHVSLFGGKRSCGHGRAHFQQPVLRRLSR